MNKNNKVNANFFCLLLLFLPKLVISFSQSHLHPTFKQWTGIPSVSQPTRPLLAHFWNHIVHFNCCWPTQTGELCVAGFHRTVCVGGVYEGIYTAVGVRDRGAARPGLMSALCFGLHCFVVWATEGLTRTDAQWFMQTQRIQHYIYKLGNNIIIRRFSNLVLNKLLVQD